MNGEEGNWRPKRDVHKFARLFEIGKFKLRVFNIS